MDLSALPSLSTDELKEIHAEATAILGQRYTLETAAAEVRAVAAAYADAGGDPADLAAALDEPGPAMTAHRPVRGV